MLPGQGTFELHPGGSVLTYTIAVTNAGPLPARAARVQSLLALLAAQPEGPFTSSATITPPAPLGDRFPDDNTQSDIDVIGVYANGFEDSAPE